MFQLLNELTKFLQKLNATKGHVITMQGTFNVTLVVDQPVAPLAVATPEDLGPAGQALPANAALSISGGTPPYTLSNLTGSVPGVTINTDGTLTGTPSTPGQYPITVTVTDSQGA
jgi:large repetitive protein